MQKQRLVPLNGQHFIQHRVLAAKLAPPPGGVCAEATHGSCGVSHDTVLTGRLFGVFVKRRGVVSAMDCTSHETPSSYI